MPFPRFSVSFRQPYHALEDDEEDEKFESNLEKQRNCAQRRFRYQYGFFILLVSNIATVLLLFTFVGREKDTTRRLDSLSILENLEHNVPTIFQPDIRFQTPHTPQDKDDPWRSLVPAGRGFIEITSHPDFEGGPLAHASGHYALSMYHQLHCLASLQSAFTMLTHSSDEISHNEHVEHLGHCFDYLRQAIMCAGDTALEKANIVPGVGSDGDPTRTVSGWGVTHLCRDWETVWEFATSHRYKNTSQIL